MNVSQVSCAKEADLDPAQLRQMAAKCRCLAKNMYDESTVGVLRRMAAEYDRMAEQRECSGPSDRRR